jgi:hypothetical protein
VSRSREDMPEPDAIDASDLAEQELREGRYANVAAERPSAAERIGGFLRPGKRWQAHGRGFACVRCGPTAHNKVAAHRHDWWHRWLDEMFATIGDDMDKLEGEIESVRAELLADVAEASERASRAEAQVAVLTRLLGPLLSRALELGDDQAADADQTVICKCVSGGWEPGTPCPHCGKHGGPTHWDACHQLATPEVSRA